MSVRLHYAYDPLCGWCYAAAPLVKALRDTGRMTLVLHGGGMLTGPRRRCMDDVFRDLIRFHEQRMHQLSGQPFGKPYTDGLLRDPSVIYDSEPPTLAILIVDALTARGDEMYAALQQAHYVDGRKIMDRDVLAMLASSLGIERVAFDRQWEIEAARVGHHYAKTHDWLARVGGQGFPTLALEREGRLLRINHGAWYGRPEAFADAMAAMLAEDTHLSQPRR
jgi:putative protein-disulfide isomerase